MSHALRRGVQLVFLALILLISLNHLAVEQGWEIPLIGSASLHAICPFGGVVSMYQLLATGELVRKIHESAVVLMGGVFLLALLFGPVFCGWICPLGTVQELVGRIGKKLFRRKYNRLIPSRIDSLARYLRYVVLAWVIYMTAATGTLIFAEYDPYFTLFNLWSDEVALSGVVILAIVLLASLFVERPFCKYACPYGAVLGLTNLFRVFGIRRSASTCINCKACDRSCPMNIQVSTAGVVRHHQCISCLECTSEAACPVEKTVSLRTVSVKELSFKELENKEALR